MKEDACLVPMRCKDIKLLEGNDQEKQTGILHS